MKAQVSVNCIIQYRVHTDPQIFLNGLEFESMAVFLNVL